MADGGWLMADGGWRMADDGMNRNRSDWNLPRDMMAMVLAPAVGLIAACYLPAVVGARRGDPTAFWIAFGSAIVGILLLFIARLPLYRQGKFLTLGSKELPPLHRQLYHAAYLFIGLSVATMLLLGLR